IHTDPDILLVDEVLSVGDLAFRQKCMHWLDRYREDKTVLFVTHTMGEVERLCDRAVYIDDGQVKYVGPVRDTSSKYWESISDQVLSQIRQRFGTNPELVEGTGDITITDVKLYDANRRDTTTFMHKTDLHVVLDLDVTKSLKAPQFTINILDPNMIPVAHCSTIGQVEQRMDLHEGHASIECTLTKIMLLKGAYIIDIEIADHTGSLRIGGMRNAAQFKITEDSKDFHVIDTGHFAFPGDWKFSNSH
ncbi:Wzt carbohydrate-binding domain-containing protein, partial [Candidatus Altiarchaeota archaeon]